MADHGTDRVVQIQYCPRKWAMEMHNTTKRFMVLVLHRRAGKSQPLSSLVLRPSGFAPMGSIQAGDRVVCPGQAEPATVVDVFPQGLVDVYRVVTATGQSARASKDHWWQVRISDLMGVQSIAVISTAEMAERVQSGATVEVPTTTGPAWCPVVSVEFDGRDDCQCIEIDHPSGLYVTDDHLVTHNTTAILNHHQRAAIDDEWELRRLKALMPGLSREELRPMLKGRFYGHVMPTRVQAKMVAWDMLKNYSRGTGATYNEQELLVRYPNGSKIQLFGSDNPDAMRGSGFSGLSFDEYSQQPVNIFTEVLSKSLADHLGYAIFAGTIKGKDHLFKTYENAKGSDTWFAKWQDIDESLANEVGLTIASLRQAMEDDRKMVVEGHISQDEFDQEWFLSTDAAIKGAIYIKELATLRDDGHITRVPYDANLPVDTDWDIGVGDKTSIWFTQSLRSGEVRVIDYLEASGEGLPFYAKALKDKGYVYGEHWAPHDIAVREFTTGKSRKDIAASLGIKFNICPKLPLEDGINAVRLFLPKCWFDEQKTRAGLDALRHYRRDYNSSMKEFKATPVHDHNSHAADGFRYLAVRHKDPKAAKTKRTDRFAGASANRRQWMGS